MVNDELSKIHSINSHSNVFMITSIVAGIALLLTCLIFATYIGKNILNSSRIHSAINQTKQENKNDATSLAT